MLKTGNQGHQYIYIRWDKTKKICEQALYEDGLAD